MPSPRSGPREEQTLNDSTKNVKRGRAPVLLLVLAVFVLAVAVGAYVLLTASSGPGERPSGSAEKPYVGGDLHSLAVDPTDPEKVMVGGHEGGAISEDGGKSWREAAGLEGADPMGWVIDPTEPQKMYAGGHPGFYSSEDGGESWSKDNSGLPATDVHGLGINAQNPETLYASIVREGLYRSPDAGESWELVNARVGTMGSILVDPRDSDTLYLAGEDALLRSTNGGENWERLGEIPDGMAMATSQDRQNPDTFYAAAGGRVFKSTDGGEGWQIVGEGLPEGVSVVQVAQGDPWIVYAGVLSETGVVLFRSEDGGESWKARNE
jgi:photosystem II stability/assembly factor-like uncharacterized protein